MVAVLHPESSELVSHGGDSATAGASASADETFESTLAATAEKFEGIPAKDVATAPWPNYAEKNWLANLSLNG